MEKENPKSNSDYICNEISDRNVHFSRSWLCSCRLTEVLRRMNFRVAWFLNTLHF